MSLKTTLKLRGFKFSPWGIQPNGGECLMFEFGHFDGLLEFGHEETHLVAVHSDKPGSGQLKSLFNTLEQESDLNHLPLRVVNLWNKGLAKWLKRRGFKLSEHPEHGLNALRRPIQN